MTSLQIKQRIDMILALMDTRWELVNCHMVNYFTDKHWDTLVPHSLRSDVPDADCVRQCVDALFENWESNAGRFPNVCNFIDTAKQHCLTNFPEISTSLNQFHKLLGDKNTSQVHIKEFMSEKKSHEVKITAQLTSSVIQKNLPQLTKDDIVIVDAGDGKGYLSTYLALKYGFKVLGVDCNETNTENALERGKKLQRAWKGLNERADLESKGFKPPARRRKKTECITNAGSEANRYEQIDVNYKTTSKYITADLNILEVVQEHFPRLQKEQRNNRTNCVKTTNCHVSENSPYICLVGLHTCGNLAPNCLRIFHNTHECRILCNVGCCYHLLKERFFVHGAVESIESRDQCEYGFPMSRYLKDKEVFLGRNARMLASQSIERTMAGKEKPNISLYYRALLEVLLRAQNPQSENSVHVGKIRKFTDFDEYLRICASKGYINLDAFDEPQIAELKNKHVEGKCYLDLFYLLRMSFAAVIESLILLDRLLYLKEQGYEQSYLVSVFDSMTSPRNYAVIAIKE